MTVVVVAAAAAATTTTTTITTTTTYTTTNCSSSSKTTKTRQHWTQCITFTAESNTVDTHTHGVMPSVTIPSLAKWRQR